MGTLGKYGVVHISPFFGSPQDIVELRASVMQIIVKLCGPFRIDRFKEESREYPAGIKVQEIVEELQLSFPLLGIVLINGKHASVTHTLKDGDTLSLLPLLGGG